MIRHAGLIATRLDGHWRGVLIEGPSGGGKSDLALRAIDQGWRLVADDRTRVFVSGGRLFGESVAPLAGLIEARGVGVTSVNSLRFAEIALLARCAPTSGAERMPREAAEMILGMGIPALDLSLLEPSAPAKLILALRHLGAGAHRGYQAPFAPLDRRAGP